jgi:hypothetical protein
MVINSLALLVTLGLFAYFGRQGDLRRASLTDLIISQLAAGLSSWIGPFILVFSDIRWQALPRAGWGRWALLSGLGLLLALPLVLIFAGLLASADVVFDALLGQLVRWLFNELFWHLLATGLVAWLVAGLLRQALLGLPTGDIQPNTWQRPRFLSLGMIELGIVLGLLDLLFLTFVIIQLRYLFGGATLVEVSPTLTYAEYARRGFFELVYVTALALPLLLLADWLRRTERPFQRRLFQGLAASMLLLLLVIVASALQRMQLYQSEYGQTELRLYTTAFMLWLAMVLVWFGLSVLRGRRQIFVAGSYALALALVLTLNWLNPDRLIVETNTERAQVARSSELPGARQSVIQPFDATYVASLSADAVPALIEALPALPPGARRLIARQLLNRWSPPASIDWRTLNLARLEAWAAVARNKELLNFWAGPAR